MEDEFDQADQDSGATQVPAKVVDAGGNGGNGGNGVGLAAHPTTMMEHRAELIKQYHGGSEGLADKLGKQGKNNMESLILALVDEIIKEGDHLLGNELLAGEQGALRDSSVISAKRAEVLEKAIKAAQTKMAFDREHGIDVDSPAMRVVFKFFMKKVKETFAYLQYTDEVADTFFRTLRDSMNVWDKELKAEIEDMEVLG